MIIECLNLHIRMLNAILLLVLKFVGVWLSQQSIDIFCQGLFTFSSTVITFLLCNVFNAKKR